jgi:excisionase family DNA binding protein
MIRSLLLDQAADLLGVSRRTVYYRIREGKLRTIRTQCGSQRVLIESIEALLREEMAPVRDRDVDASSTAPSARFPVP